MTGRPEHICAYAIYCASPFAYPWALGSASRHFHTFPANIGRKTLASKRSVHLLSFYFCFCEIYLNIISHVLQKKQVNDDDHLNSFSSFKQKHFKMFCLWPMNVKCLPIFIKDVCKHYHGKKIKFYCTVFE